MGTTYDGTIDWDRYWATANDEDTEGASPSADLIVDPFLEFHDEMGVSGPYADVGCGAGAVVFDLAERYPETSVVGYDSARQVLARNRERTRDASLANIEFEQCVLPVFDPERRFEVVSCFYMLVYVAEAERALRNLYDAVAPGGFLVLTYHNRLARAQFRNVAEALEEYLDQPLSFEPGRYAERFELLIEGENLLSYDRIHDVLGV